MADINVVRDRLVRLLERHLVIMQDVPKTADHSASRTIFLWRVNLEKCAQNLAMDCYKGMANLNHVREAQAIEARVLLEKAARSDVAADMDKYLTEAEKQGLQQHERVTQLLRLSELRMERQVSYLQA